MFSGAFFISPPPITGRGIVMDFELPHEVHLAGKTARELAGRYPPSYWREKEDRHEFADDFWKELSDAGFTGVVVPEEYGGTGLGVLALGVIMENLALGGTGLAGAWYLMLTEVFTALPIARYGTYEQKEAYLPRLASGRLEGCMALTEPQAGSNTLAIQTFAEDKGDHYLVNGRKIFISGADRAGLMLLVARTRRASEVPRKTLGITLLLVDLPDPTVECTPIPKHGINYSTTCEVSIENLRVPKENTLGPKDYGWWILLDVLNPERIGFSLAAIGLGELAINKAVEYMKGRRVFDRPIGAFQALQHPLAEAYANLQAARLLAYKAAHMYDTQNPPPSPEKVRDPQTIQEQGRKQREVGAHANMAKVVAIEHAHRAVYWAMQAHGGMGYARETHVERWWREINLLRIAPVTQQIALNHIAHHVLGLPRSY